MNESQKKLIHQLNKMKTLDLELMKYSYELMYHGAANKFEYDIHILKMIKCKNGWKSVSLDQRRFAYKQICGILKIRKEFAKHEKVSKSNSR